MKRIKAVVTALMMFATFGTVAAQENSEAETPRLKRDGSSLYGDHIISVAVIQFNNESAAGFGIGYEGMLNESGTLSWYLPVTASFVNGSYHTNNPDIFFMGYPGLKYYPTGSRGVVRYSVGVALALGGGNIFVDNERRISEPYRVKARIMQMGAILNNSLNFQPTPHFYLGLEAGIGLYMQNNKVEYNSNFSSDPMLQISFKVGYRL